jgi:hypothetical protein
MFVPFILVLAVMPELPIRSEQIQHIWGARPQYTKNATYTKQISAGYTVVPIGVAVVRAPRLMVGMPLVKRPSVAGDGESSAPMRSVRPGRRASNFSGRGFAVIAGRKV